MAETAGILLSRRTRRQILFQTVTVPISRLSELPRRREAPSSLKRYVLDEQLEISYEVPCLRGARVPCQYARTCRRRDGLWSLDPQQLGRSAPDVCVQLMRRAFNMADPVSFERAIDARREMEMARGAYFDGDELSCKRHAIQAFEDRTQPG